MGRTGGGPDRRCHPPISAKAEERKGNRDLSAEFGGIALRECLRQTKNNGPRKIQWRLTAFRSVVVYVFGAKFIRENHSGDKMLDVLIVSEGAGSFGSNVFRGCIAEICPLDDSSSETMKQKAFVLIPSLLCAAFLCFVMILPTFAAAQQQAEPCRPDPQDSTRCAPAAPVTASPSITTENEDQQSRNEESADDRQKKPEDNRNEQQSQRPDEQHPGEQRPDQQQRVEKQIPRKPAQATNPFVSSVNDYTSKNLTEFGLSVFAQPPSTFAPGDNLPVTADYTIGPGDELVIHAWGQIDINYRGTVDRTGRVYLPKVGEINVAGVRYDQVESQVRAAIARNFHDFQLSVSLGRLRSIRIFVVGRSAKPGAYTVSSLSTIVNAVISSGGPTVNGSLRRVQLKRGDKVVSEFDFYDLLTRGDKSKDTFLLPGDVIYIPPVGPQVALMGAVAEPAVYELKDEKSMSDLLATIGGLPNIAEISKARVERYSEAQKRTVTEIALKGESLNLPIQNGDLITIFSMSQKFENSVLLRGSISRAGRYPFHPGVKVKDLIPNAEFLVPESVWKSRNSNTTGIAVGATPAPDLNWEYASIERLNPADLTAQIIPFNLRKAIDGDPQENKELQAEDIVTVYTQKEIRSSIAVRPVFVRVDGEVNSPGLYRALPGEHLRDFMKRVSNDLTSQAYLFGATFSRDSVKRRQQENIEKAVRTLELERTPARRRPSTVSTANSANPAETAALAAQEDEKARQGMIDRLRSIQPTGRIVLTLSPSSDSIANLPDFQLEDGDVLRIPSRSATVSVFGSIYNGADFLYGKEDTVGEYLKMAGGPTRSADKDKIYVLRVNGSVKGGGSKLGGGIEKLRLMPGDTIFVPERAESQRTFGESFRDWTQVIYQLGLGAAAIKVLME
jgi:polysaccharide biosynthesis/export protein